MTANHHTPIVTGAAANASTINSPLGEIDAAVSEVSVQAQAALDAVSLNGTAATLANGSANAGQKVVTVDSSSAFVAGCRVEYGLVGGAIELNTVDTVDSPTQITLETNIGTGGIPDNGLITVVPTGFLNAQHGTFNVRDYGALGDNSNDDSAAIQAAVTAAWAMGGTVYFPPGFYKCNSGITLPSSDAADERSTVHLQGAANNEVGEFEAAPAKFRFGSQLYFTMTDGSDGIAMITSGSSHSPTVIIENLSIVGPDSTSAGGQSGNGLRISGTAIPYIYLRNVRVGGFYGANKAGIWLEAGNYAGLQNVFIKNCYYGLKLSGSYNDSTQTNVGIHNCVYGVDAYMTGTLNFFGGLVQSCEKSGMILRGSCWPFILHGMHFENNNSTDTAGEYALKVIGAATKWNGCGSIDACVFGGTRDKIFLAGNGSGYPAQYISIMNCRMDTVSSPIITLDDEVTGLVVSNTCALADIDTSGATLDGLIVLWEGTIYSSDRATVASLGVANHATAGTNEVQRVTVDATGGHFHLIYDGYTSNDIGYNATAAQLLAEINYFPNIGNANIEASGGPLPGTPVDVTFKNAKGSTDLNMMTTNATALTGGASTAVVSEQTKGVAAVMGPVVAKYGIYDDAGTLLGYVPVYAAIT